MRLQPLALLTLALATLPPPVVTQEAVAVTEIARTYLSTLYEFDFEGLTAHLSPEAVFRDVTATAIAGAPLEYEGRDAILAGFEAGAAGSRNSGFEIEREFVTGQHVVFTLIYNAELKGEAVGKPGAWVPVRIPAVTILTIADGKVSEHVDYVDYDEMLRQVAAFGR